MQCIRTTFPPSSPIFFLPHILSSSSPPSLLFTPLPPNIPSSLSHSHSAFLSPLSLSSFFSSPATAPLTSHYNFSLYDETSFDADLLLSNGELHSEMLRTEFCLQGRAYYNINILTVSTKVTIGIPIGQEFKTLDYIHLDCLLIAHIPASRLPQTHTSGFYTKPDSPPIPALQCYSWKPPTRLSDIIPTASGL